MQSCTSSHLPFLYCPFPYIQGESFWIIRENGGFDSSQDPDDVQNIGDAQRQIFLASDVTVLFAAGFSGGETQTLIEISVGGEIGVTVLYQFSELSLYNY